MIDLAHHEPIKAMTPAFYWPSWAPWLRIVIMVGLVFGALLVWHHTP